MTHGDVMRGNVGKNLHKKLGAKGWKCQTLVDGFSPQLLAFAVK